MGEICKLTGLPTVNYSKSEQAETFVVNFGGRVGQKEIKVCRKCQFPTESHGWYLEKEFKRAMIGLITSGKFDPEEYGTIHWSKDRATMGPADIALETFLNQAIYPNSTKERRHGFLKYLYSLQQYDCQEIETNLRDVGVWGANYFLNEWECYRAFEFFERRGFIDCSLPGAPYEVEWKFTHDGLIEIDRLASSESNANEAFVAMAFTEKTIAIREAIKRAIDRAGFTPILVDEVRIENDKTIPDKIFASIRQARFCIADFTGHRNGVYFEAGYAVGLGIPVFYTCQKQDFEEAHFDIKQLQQILYDTPEDLETELVDKINAWIN